MQIRLFNIKKKKFEYINERDISNHLSELDKLIHIVSNHRNRYYYLPKKTAIIEIPKSISCYQSHPSDTESDLFKIVDKDIKRDREKPLFKDLIINMHSKCNLDCKYCFGFSKDKELETPTETIVALISYLYKKRYSLNRIYFLGSGETLLEFNRFKDIVSILKQYYPNVPIIVVTNGILSKQKIDWLIKRKINIRLSCDGPAFINDVSRPIKNSTKKPSETVHANLQYIVKNTSLFTIAPTITKLSQGFESNILYFFWKLGVKLDKISWNHASCRGKAKEQPTILMNYDEINRSQIVWDELEDILGDYTKTNMFVNMMGTPFLCGTINFGWITIDERGCISSCSKHVNSLNNSLIEKLLIGRYDFESKKILISSNSIKNTNNWIISVMEKTDCFNCEYLSLCRGPCFYDSLVIEDNIGEDNKTNIQCIKRKNYVNNILQYLIETHMWKKYPHHLVENGIEYFNYSHNKFEIRDPNDLPNKFQSAIKIKIDVENNLGKQIDHLINLSNSENYCFRFFLLEFKINLTNPEQIAKKINHFLGKLQQNFVCFLVLKPLPYCVRRYIKKTFSIPNTCLECNKMFTVKDNKVIFCDGSDGKKFDKYVDRTQIFNDFKKINKNTNNLCLNCIYKDRKLCFGYVENINCIANN